MRRDEILAKSRQENREIDEREKQVEKTAWYIAATVGLLIFSLIEFINFLVFGIDNDWIGIPWSAAGIIFGLIYYIKLRKPLGLVITIFGCFGMIIGCIMYFTRIFESIPK